MKVLYGTTSCAVSDTLYDRAFSAFIPPQNAIRLSFPTSTNKTTATLKVPAHVVADSLVVKETLDAADGADGQVLVPQFPVGELHDVLLGNGINLALNLARVHPAASCDELATNVLGHGGCAVQRQEDRGLELSLGTLNLGLGDVAGKARPLTKGEVDKVVKGGKLVRDKVDTPEAETVTSVYIKVIQEYS